MSVGPRHHGHIWRKVDIGESAQCRIGPGGEVAHCQMNHHCRRTGTQSGCFGIGAVSRRREHFAEQMTRMHIGDYRTPRVETAAIVKVNSSSTPVFDNDVVDRGLDQHFAATCRNRADHGLDDIIRSTLSEGHAERLRDHAFEIGKNCPAGDIGCEIKMQPPHRHHGLHLRGFEPRVEPCAGRRQNKTPQFAQKCIAIGAPGIPKGTCDVQGGHTCAEQGKNMWRSTREFSGERAPLLLVGLAESANTCSDCLEVTFDTKPFAVGKG